MNIGNAIKFLRKKKGLTQAELANKAAITQAALSQIENGKRPGVQTIKKISLVFDLPESLIYALGIEKEDVSKEKEVLYEKLFPVIKNLILELGD